MTPAEEPTPLVTLADLEVAVRRAKPTEIRWIQATWSSHVKSPKRRTSVPFGSIEVAPPLVLRAHTLLVDDLLGASDAYVATMPGDDALLVGWIVFAHPTLHFCYVVPEARGEGVARALVAASGCSFASHMTKRGARLLPRSNAAQH